MIKLFEPKTKVQKNRQIMRDTDLRMAKYGRRGLISNFFIFTLCLFTSDTFVHEQPRLAAVLSVGLLFSTLIRGYFLFRIDSIYPRAPMAWRNKYFLATLAGAVWWCVIMISITLVLKMQEQAPLMWLYTVVFFSTTAHAFSPYKNFLSIYQFIGIVPAALSTVFIGDIIGVFYSAILLMFYWILHHHSELMSKTYWGHLEANYTLTRKAESLEEEKRDTRATVQLSNEYLGLLAQKMLLFTDHSNTDKKYSESTAATEGEQLDKLQNNLDAFYKIINKDVAVEPKVFNVRHYLQYLVRQQQSAAEKSGVELETAIAPALPSRLIGDVQKLGEIIECIVGQAIEQVGEGRVFVEMEFAREYENSGQLLLTLACQSSSLKRKFFNDHQTFMIQPSLELVLAKGLAETLGGTLDIGEAVSVSGKSLCFRVRMNVAELNPRLDYHRAEYKNRPMLLINQNARWLDHKRLELDTLGFDVSTLKDFKKGAGCLLQAINEGNSAFNVVYAAQARQDSASDFANELLSHHDLKHTHQFVICSTEGKKYFQDRLVNASPTIHYVAKPSGLFEFEMAANSVFCKEALSLSNGEKKTQQTNNVLWLVSDKKASSDRMCEFDSMQIHRIDDVKHVAKCLAEHPIKLVVIEHSEKTTQDTVQIVREYEQQQRTESLVPIIAVGMPEAQRVMFELGVDQFVTTDSIVLGDTNELCYWLTGRYA